jgi:type IV pilus assembly protein PilB
MIRTRAHFHQSFPRPPPGERAGTKVALLPTVATTAETAARDAIVQRVERALGGLDPALARALREVPRDIFSAAELAALDYDGRHLMVREGRMIPPPEVVARMIAALALSPGERVLEIGTGVGYATALLARMAGEVCSVEWIDFLADLSTRTLGALAARNIRLKRGDASAWREKAPFNAILVSAGSYRAPAHLRDQLAIGGRLVMPVGNHRSRQSLLRVTRRAKDEFVEEGLGELRFVKRLGDLLVESGAADRVLVEKLAKEAAIGRRRLGDVLRDGAQIAETDLARALASQRGLKFGTIDDLIPRVDPELVRSVPRPFLEHHGVIPIAREGGRIELATSDPEAATLELSKVFHPSTPELWLVTPTDYRRLWNAIDLMLSGSKPAPAAPAEAVEIGPGEEPRLEQRFVDLFESMLLEAIAERASDIHLERYGERVRVRIRVDGDLRDVPRYRLSPTDLVGIVNVIKIRANLNIAEHRLPQGGRIRVRAGGKNFDLRVQTQPSLHGEHSVIRLLPQDVKLLTIEDLGFSPEVAREYRRLLEHPSGLVLVVGPTGSGKTTTLYAGLQILAKDPTRKAISVEDPIEYAIENVQQAQVKPEIGFSFADAMRSFVRQDPDVILVGEIRDSETALEAIRASQTGHLVLSTLHCNDTTDAVQRLIDLQMHPNSIASELLAVISQRLPRRICEGCRVETKPDPELLGAVFPGGAPPGFGFWKGAGCSRCSGHGAYGRIACVEFLKANSELRAAIARHPPVEELRRMALDADLIPLRDTALDLVRRGSIALQELPFMLSWERLAPERKA